MTVIAIQVSGVLIFLLVTAVLATSLQRRPKSQAAEKMSRISHFGFWSALSMPWTLGMVYPGPAALDDVVGLPSLPLPIWTRLLIGVPLLLGGMALAYLATKGLGREGKGAPAFRLTSDVVATGVYGRVRNPMSLGYYAICVGVAIAAGASWMLLYTIIGVVPVHAINLKWFEERELALRYGDPYVAYRDSTPFLIPRVQARDVASGATRG